MSPCSLDEWRHAVAEPDAGATSHEAPPLAYLLEHSSWRLAGSVKRLGDGGRCRGAGGRRGGGKMGRQAAQWRRSMEGGWRGGGGVWKADDAVEAERSREIFLSIQKDICPSPSITVSRGVWATAYTSR
jgi:hypothetical protein